MGAVGTVLTEGHTVIGKGAVAFEERTVVGMKSNIREGCVAVSVLVMRRSFMVLFMQERAVFRGLKGIAVGLVHGLMSLMFAFP